MIETNRSLADLREIFEFLCHPYKNILDLLNNSVTESEIGFKALSISSNQSPSLPKFGQNSFTNDSFSSKSSNTSESSSVIVSAPNRRRRASIRESVQGILKYYERRSSFIGTKNNNKSIYDDNDSTNGKEKTPIEPSDNLAIFLPLILGTIKSISEVKTSPSAVTGALNSDIETPNKNRKYHPSGASNLAKSASIPLTLRRDEFGSLLITQSELLIYVWLPLVKKLKVSELRHYTAALIFYFCALKDSKIEPLPTLSLYLIFLLSHSNQKDTLISLLQHHFFPDNISVAYGILELRTKEEKIASAVSVSLQDAAINMLWRLQEQLAVVKWYLRNGLVHEAMSLCAKTSGHYRPNLHPGNISGIDFFSSAVIAIERVAIKGDKECQRELSKRKAFLNKHYGVNELHKSSSNEIKKLIVKERTEIMYKVYYFIMDWDHTLLESVSENLNLHTFILIIFALT